MERVATTRVRRSPAVPLAGAFSRVAQSWEVLARNRLAVVGLTLISIGLLTAIFAPLIATHDAYEINIAHRLNPPTAEHWFGTDFMGRDTFTRLVFGARTAFLVAIGAVLIGALIGFPFGAISAYCGGRVDSAMMRVNDALLAFPGRLLAIALVASLGGGLFSLYIAIGISAIPSNARIIRAVVLSQKERDYVEASRMVGESHSHILFREILPNCVAPLIVNLSLDFPRAILIESSLSFLGLGFPPPTPSWGLMLKEVTPFLELQPWAAFFPGLAITLMILGFNLFGDGLRDVLDPRHYQRRGEKTDEPA
jgi:peptide/nickel transport system permease protein